MVPLIPTTSISARRKAIALFLAGFSDLLQLAVIPAFAEGIFSPAEDVLDIVTAIVLIAVCGFRWQLLLSFAAELVPGLDLFPSWTAAVLSLSVTSRAPELKPPIIERNDWKAPPESDTAQHNEDQQ